uniref:Uncharacterized protein n=1 Tax=Nelumbo nucifera TaxID=4432 RepID=A0A822XIV2_NELNU|nr:TPA_asm: hypothetical protein HUJ06_020379 [Nelumbo nucifera]
MELQETTRLRDRVNKKDRDRDRSSRNKRRRGDRLMHGSNREEGGEECTEESVDDDEDEDAGAVRMLPPNPPSSSLSNHHHHRKSFPPAKVVRVAPTWKVPDEMSVPRKARSGRERDEDGAYEKFDVLLCSFCMDINRKFSYLLFSQLRLKVT